MKITVNLGRALTDELGDLTASLPATAQLGDLLEASGVQDAELDLVEILRTNRMIAHLFTTEDVQTQRPDLSADQAWEVLQAVERNLDSEYGIGWGDLRHTADELFPPPPEFTARLSLVVTQAGVATKAQLVELLQAIAADIENRQRGVQAALDADSLRREGRALAEGDDA